MLRQRWDPGAKYMPGMRDKLVRGRQRQFIAPGIALAAAQPVKAANDMDFRRYFQAAATHLIPYSVTLPTRLLLGKLS